MWKQNLSLGISTMGSQWVWYHSSQNKSETNLSLPVFLPHNHFVVIQSLSRVCVVTPWTAAFQASLSFAISQSLLKLMSTELVMPSNRFILCRLILLLPPSIFKRCLKDPASGSFPMSQFFASGGQSIGVSASASILPMNNQAWFPLW